MQFLEEDCVLHLCFHSLRTAIMGCCYSICHKENDQQEHIINERTHLLEVPEQHHDASAPCLSSSAASRKPDEQTALNRILHETATNVIDVAALGPYALEPAVYNERVRAYTARLSGGPSGVPPQVTPRLLRDVPHSERTSILAKPGVLSEDRDLITNAVKRAAAAMSELRVEHHEELVVPFRVP